MLRAIINRSRSARTWVVAILAAGILGGATVAASSAASAAPPKPTVVLVHGSFADASSWSSVIGGLQKRGYPVIAPANPLRGLTSGTTYLKNVLDQIDGPIVLVGHSYGGAVITNAATGNANVKALVYIAAFAPLRARSSGS